MIMKADTLKFCSDIPEIYLYLRIFILSPVRFFMDGDRNMDDDTRTKRRVTRPRLTRAVEHVAMNKLVQLVDPGLFRRGDQPLHHRQSNNPLFSYSASTVKRARAKRHVTRACAAGSVEHAATQKFDQSTDPAPFWCAAQQHHDRQSVNLPF